MTLTVSGDASVTVTEGDSLTLMCSSDATPPASYSYYHGNNKTSGPASGSHTISSVSDSDEGSWYCEAANMFGTVKSNSLSVVVKGKSGYCDYDLSLIS